MKSRFKGSLTLEPAGISRRGQINFICTAAGGIVPSFYLRHYTKFFQRKVAFLGHIATESGTECDPEKTAAIQNWPRPTNVKKVRSFLGLVNFYRSYIPQCATIAYRMNQLTRKHVKFKLDERCEESFNTLKHCLVTPPILAYPTCTGKFLLQTDASGQGIGAILSQEQDGHEVVKA